MTTARDEAAGMSDAELIAAFIRGGTSADACDLAKRLLARFGGLRPLLQADAKALTREAGIGTARSQVILALPEVARRFYAAALPPGETIRSPSDTMDFFHARIGDLGHELFCCLYLDNRHRVLRFDEMFRGTIDGTSVYPREVVKEALAVNAAAVILGHNR